MSRSADKTLNVTLPDDTGEFGTFQRLFFFIPNPSTTFVLGHRFPDGSRIGYEGVSLQTSQSLFADITERTLFQGHKTVVLQTDEDWFQYSTGRTVLYAKANVDVTSATTLVLSAAVPEGDHDPPVGAAMMPLQGETIPDVASFVDIRDALLADQKTDIARLDDLASTFATHKKALGAAYAEGEVKDLGARMKDLATSVESTAEESTAGIALVASRPIALYTPDAILAHASGGVTLAAGEGDAPSTLTGLATGAVVLRAGADAELFAAGTARLEGGAGAEVGSKGPVAVGSREGKVALLAPALYLGSTAPADHLGALLEDTGKQKPTDTIDAAAKTAIALASDDRVEVTAKKKVTIKVGSFTVVLNTSSITIGKEDGTTLVEIKGDAITVQAGPADSVTVKQGSGVKLASGPSQVTASSSGVSLAGPSIKLG